jgi:hypothetical protein
MTPQEKTIANKLLADFDGLETQPIKEGDTILFDYRNNKIDYSCDWNLLMSCCKKVQTYKIDNFPELGIRLFWKSIDFLNNSVTKLYRKEDCFIALIDIINFLNSQKN